jgi:hypothetical protein
MSAGETAKALGAIFIILLGVGAWLYMLYNPDTYAPPQRVQRVEVVR